MVHAEINDFDQETTGTSAETDLQKSRLLFHFEKVPNLLLVWWQLDGPLSWEILHQEVETANPKNSDVQRYQIWK
jgi:hypothetical protein